MNLITKVKKLSIILILTTLLIFSGCSQANIDTAVKQLPQVKAYLEANPNFELQITHYSLEESSQINAEFKANCGKEFISKDIYRFVVDDQKSLSGVGYFDLKNNVLECFKKKTGTKLEVEGTNVDDKSENMQSIVVDNVLVAADGSVKVGTNTKVDSDGSVEVGGVSISKDNIVKVNDEITVGNDGNVQVGDIKISNGNVQVGDISVNANGDVTAGGVQIQGNSGNGQISNEKEEILNETDVPIEEDPFFNDEIK